MHGEYPIARIEFDDTALTLDIALTALSPLDSDPSEILGATLRYPVTDKQHLWTPVTVLGSMSKSLFITGLSVFVFPEFAGSPNVENGEE